MTNSLSDCPKTLLFGLQVGMIEGFEILKGSRSSPEKLLGSGLWRVVLVSRCGSDGKVSAYNVGDLGSNPGLGRSPGEGNGNPLQYSCLENSMGLQRIRHD